MNTKHKPILTVEAQRKLWRGHQRLYLASHPEQKDKKAARAKARWALTVFKFLGDNVTRPHCIDSAISAGPDERGGWSAEVDLKDLIEPG
jgi:hypothetical protein